ncbi:MAG: response regulator transcription factor, partial [Tsuneonella sp.]
MNVISQTFAQGCSIEQLTAKEREVLAHLAQHKTSKQIGLDLGISENTVNKHIAAVRTKWGTRDRNETARVFILLHEEGSENHPPQFLAGDEYLITSPDAVSDLPRSTQFRLSDVLASKPFEFPDQVAPEGLEALDARFGKVWRIAAIPLLALALAMVML